MATNQRRKELRKIRKQKLQNIIPTGTKVCRRCGIEKDVSEFNRNYANKDSLCGWCKECQSAANKERKANLTHISVQTKFCPNCGITKDINEFWRDSKTEDGHFYICIDCQTNHNEEYYDIKPDEVLSVHRQWRDNNPEKYRQSIKNYHQSEEGIIADRLYHKKKREKMNQLPHTFTDEEWQDCLKYFDYSCAYCGSKNKIQQDHFISIFNDGPYTKDNMVVACGFCNPSKGDKNFFEWYPEQDFYDKEREDKILNYLGCKKE